MPVEDVKKASVTDLFHKLSSNVNGLTSVEVKKRIQQYGYNEIPEKKIKPLLKFLKYFWWPIPWMIEERHPRPRIEGLADLVFGLSLSLGALSLVVSPASSISEINNHILVFVLTFLILITIWINYTASMSVLPIEARRVMVLNVIMLLLVALVPFLLNAVKLSNASLTVAGNLAIRNYAGTLFTVDLFGLLLILGLFYWILKQKESKLHTPRLLRLYKNGRNLMFILAGIMLLSAAPIFSYVILGNPVRLYLWYVPIILFWLRRLTGFRF
jgi:uncharacterized membrane protein